MQIEIHVSLPICIYSYQDSIFLHRRENIDRSSASDGASKRDLIQSVGQLQVVLDEAGDDWLGERHVAVSTHIKSQISVGSQISDRIDTASQSACGLKQAHCKLKASFNIFGLILF